MARGNPKPRPRKPGADLSFAMHTMPSRSELPAIAPQPRVSAIVDAREPLPDANRWNSVLSGVCIDAIAPAKPHTNVRRAVQLSRNQLMAMKPRQLLEIADMLNVRLEPGQHIIRQIEAAQAHAILHPRSVRMPKLMRHARITVTS